MAAQELEVTKTTVKELGSESSDLPCVRTRAPEHDYAHPQMSGHDRRGEKVRP